jgi:hypothetical protein
VALPTRREPADASETSFGTSWEPLDPAGAGPAAFLLFAKGLVREVGERVTLGLWAGIGRAATGSADAIASFLTQAGHGASTTYDRRLCELARGCSWAGGAA